VIEKTITIFRNKKNLKNLKFGLLWFFRFFKKPKKNLGFLKATSTALARLQMRVQAVIVGAVGALPLHEMAGLLKKSKKQLAWCRLGLYLTDAYYQFL